MQTPIPLVASLFLSLIMVTVRTTAQSVAIDSIPTHRSAWRIGGGTGLMLPVGLPASIFRQIGVNTQVGILYEYYWRRRWFILSGVEYRLQNISADARFIPVVQGAALRNYILIEPDPDSEVV